MAQPIIVSSSVAGQNTALETLTLTITGSGATASLGNTPLADDKVNIAINGQVFDSLPGSGVTVSGTAVTFDNVLLGLVLDGTERVVASYPY